MLKVVPSGTQEGYIHLCLAVELCHSQGKLTLQVREGVLVAARSSGLLADARTDQRLPQPELLDLHLKLSVAAGLSKFDHREAVVPKAGLAGVVEKSVTQLPLDLVM